MFQSPSLPAADCSVLGPAAELRADLVAALGEMVVLTSRHLILAQAAATQQLLSAVLQSPISV